MATLVLFDGDCGFCRASVAFAAQRLQAEANVRFVAMQSDEGREALITHGFAADYDRSVVVIEDGRATIESDATLRLAKYLRRPWRWLGVGRIVPRAVRDAAYRWVVRHRGEIPVGNGACAVDSHPR